MALELLKSGCTVLRQSQRKNTIPGPEIVRDGEQKGVDLTKTLFTKTLLKHRVPSPCRGFTVRKAGGPSEDLFYLFAGENCRLMGERIEKSSQEMH